MATFTKEDETYNNDNDKVSWLIDEVHKSGGIEYSKEKMQAYKQEAIAILNSFEDSMAKQSLLDLVEYTIERKK